MRLWTVQHPKAWETLRAGRTFRADGRRADRSFRGPYRWMMWRMRELLGCRGRFPVWAMATPKLDMRRNPFRSWARPSVRLEVEVPEERVLLSDLDGWNLVLCSEYVPASPEDDAEREARWTARWAGIREEVMASTLTPPDFADVLEHEFLAEKIGSWERIFDLDAMGHLFRHPDFEGTDHVQFVQACVEEIRPDEVIRADVYDEVRHRAARA